MAYHNPEGMNDLTDIKCYVKKIKEEKLRKLFSNYGFMEIETPCLEYFDMYYGENEYVNQQDIFKLIDKTGSLLVLRPDMTVPSCRVAATKIRYEALPYKLSYIAKCFRADEFGGGKQREFTQCGAEIIGSDNPYYDALVIKLAINAAKRIGINDISIQIGQVEFFNGLAEQASLSQKECEIVSKMIDSKDSFGISEFLDGKKMEKSIYNHITSITGYFGDKKLIEKLIETKLNARSLQALKNLKSILDILEQMGCSKYITVDLSMVKKLGYYTGMIFNGNTYQMGFSILAGGRYDNLAKKMGKQLEATGFSLSLEMALKAIERQGLDEDMIKSPTIISFSEEMRNKVLSITKDIEEERNLQVMPDSDDLIKYMQERNALMMARCMSMDTVLVYSNGIVENMDFDKWRKTWNI
ncbi:MAG TPA: ATP phosphoribosyltransferase regulatory subunit [Clostridia bacterium]|nr:MAG: ATP phosphoribosyltransferase regulatory subunit [Firmicutes bacterium ADurb.Bin146]HOD93296.1 ATP phosphoribosyltransferase regulatory subunit [Clostridia bacterium]HQM39348.1 ATP phosphoribosyltransferase regulatory subunit [Clostridia bacterium]